MPSNVTQIPALRVPLIDAKTGLMSREWYRFFINLFTLTGDGSNTASLTDLQVGPPSSLDGLIVNQTYADLTPPTAAAVNFDDLAPPNIPNQPAGSNTQVQYNNGGVFGASSNFTYDSTAYTLTVGPAGQTTTIETLAPTGSTITGTLRIRGKNASATNGAGGPLSFIGGTALGTGTGGGISFNPGNGGSTGGNFTVTAGTGTVTGGGFNLSAGQGTSGSGGNFTLSAGIGGSGTATGGGFELYGGNASASGAAGGFVLSAGSSVSGAGGDFTLLPGGGATSGNMYFGDSIGNNVIWVTDDLTNPRLGFFNATPVVKPTAVPITAAGIHAALVSLGLIS